MDVSCIEENGSNKIYINIAVLFGGRIMDSHKGLFDFMSTGKIPTFEDVLELARSEEDIRVLLDIANTQSVIDREQLLIYMVFLLMERNAVMRKSLYELGRLPKNAGLQELSILLGSMNYEDSSIETID